MEQNKNTLSENDRKKLDDIVLKMMSEKKSNQEIQATVDNFKNQYGLKKKELTQSDSGNGKSVLPSKEEKLPTVETPNEKPINQQTVETPSETIEKPVSILDRYKVGEGLDRDRKIAEQDVLSRKPIPPKVEKTTIVSKDPIFGLPVYKEKTKVITDDRERPQQLPKIEKYAGTGVNEVESQLEKEAKTKYLWESVQKDIDESYSITSKEHFRRLSGAFANAYLDEAQLQEYSFVQNLRDADERVKSAQSVLEKHPSNPAAQLSLSKAIADKAQQEAQYTKFKEGKYKQIDAEIKDLEEKINLNPITSTYWDAFRRDDYINRIKDLKAQKENFFLDENALIQKKYSENKSTLDKFQIPGDTPRERLQNYYLTLNKERDLKLQRLKNTYGEDVFKSTSGATMASLASFIGTDATLDKFFAIEEKMKSLAPAVLINRNPVKDVNQGFFETTLKNAVQTIAPVSQYVISNPSELASYVKESLALSSLPDDVLSKATGKIVSEKAKGPESYNKEWWGNIVGTSVGMIPYFAAGTSLVKSASVAMDFAKIAKYLAGAKYGKYLVSSPVMTGLGYQTAGYLMPANSLVKDEATFLSGFLGGVAQAGINKIINTSYIAQMFNKLFGDKAEAMAIKVAKSGERIGSGVGEYAEEVGNTVGEMINTWSSTGDFKKLKSDFEQNFGSMDKNLELFVASFTMGAIMSHGNAYGKTADARSRDYYNNLSAEDKKKADSFVERLTQERYNAMVAAKKDEIKKSGVKAEPVTPKDLTDRQDAIDVLTDQKATPEERKAALSVLADVDIKIENDKITKAAEAELKAGDTSTEVKPEDATIEPIPSADGTITTSEGTVEPASIETQKADIEKRRKEEIDRVTQAPSAEVIDEEGNAINTSEQIAEINAKYDAELNDLNATIAAEESTSKSTEGKTVAKEKAAKPTAEAKPLTEGDQVQLDPQIKGGMPRVMEFKNGTWQQKVGNEYTTVSKEVQQEAQNLYDSQNKQRVSGEVRVGQEPIQAKPIEGGSQETSSTGGNVQASEEVTKPSLVTPEVVDNFINTGKVDEDVLTSIAEKIKNNEALTKDENTIFSGKVSEVNKILTQLKDVAGTVELKSMEMANKNVTKFLQDSDIGVNILETQEEFDEALKNEGKAAERGAEGVFIGDSGKVFINKSALGKGWAKTILYHEATHPVINIIRNTNPTKYKALVNGIKELAKTNKDVQEALDWAKRMYKGSPEGTIEDEGIVEVIARVADGKIKFGQINPTLRERIIDFMNQILRALGKKEITPKTDTETFKKTARGIANAMRQGKSISKIVGKENVKEYKLKEFNEADSPGVVAAGQFSKAAAATTEPINVYGQKDVEKLPVRTLNDIHKQFDGKSVVINSDPTKVGELALPSGKTIFTYGGPGFVSLKNNVNSNVAFATTQIQKVKIFERYIKELFPDGKGLGLIATQAPTSMLSNSYALRYVMDAISQLPKSVLRSSDFKSEFFGKDLVLLKDAFGDKGYAEFVSKYKSADLTNEEVIDNMISEMGYKIGANNNPASFKARGSFTSNLLGGLVEKNKRKGFENEAGFFSVTPSKYISKQLFDRFGLNTEALLYALGEKSIVDAFIKEGKWGYAVAGFETDPAISVESVQDKGLVHPLFNAKFPGVNPFILNGGYELNKMYTPIDITSQGGNPYTKTAAQMLAGSMYVKGAPTQSEDLKSFEQTKAKKSIGKIEPPVTETAQKSKGGRETVVVDGVQQRVASVPDSLSIVDGFYSPIEKRITEFKQPKASATKWKEIVGSKSDEAVFSGIADWLNTFKPDQQISKEEVQDFIKNNRVEIKQVIKADNWREFYDERMAEVEKEMEYFRAKGFDAYTISRTPDAMFDKLNDADQDRLIDLKAERDFLNDVYFDYGDSRQTLTSAKEEDMPKYIKYINRGDAQNYKEILVTAPVGNKLEQANAIIEKRLEAIDDEIEQTREYKKVGDTGTVNDFKLVVNDQERYDSLVAERKSLIAQEKANTEKIRDLKNKEYKSSHYNEKNIIVHTRTDVRRDSDDNKVFFIEEVQSDWGQEGLKKGFRSDEFVFTEEDQAKYRKLLEKGILTAEEGAELYRLGVLKDKHKANVEGVAKAPYVTNTNSWTKLGLKIALQQAVKEGADKIAWTTGEQQNKRYDLSKQVDAVTYEKNDDGTYNVDGIKNNRSVSYKEDVQANQLESMLGKDVAERIINDEGDTYFDGKYMGGVKVLTGDQLTVGGKGMTAFYGNMETPGILGNVAKALVKELTGVEPKIEGTALGYSLDQEDEVIKTLDEYDNSLKKGGIFYHYGEVLTKSQALEYIERGLKIGVSYPKADIQPSIVITPELRAAVEKGMPQFSRGERGVAADTEKVFDKATDLFYKIKGTEGSAKRKALADERKALMDKNPSIKFIDDNIKNVLDQLEAKEVATRKGNCP